MPDDDGDDRTSDARATEPDENARQLMRLSTAEFMSAVILRPREPFVNWVRQHLGAESATLEHEAAAPAVAITPELPRAEDQEAWLRQFGDQLFVSQLEVWAGASEWPANRSLEELRAWFDVEFVPAVDDLRECHVPIAVTCEPVSLAEVVDQFEMLAERGVVFVDVSSGAIVALSEDEMEAIEEDAATAIGIAEEDLETLRRAYNSPSLVDVMSRGDFDEFAAMEHFAASMPAASVRNRLLDALRGHRPFRRFKDVAHAVGVRDKWFAWRHAALADALRAALGDCQIPFVDDLVSRDTSERRTDGGSD